MKKEKPQLEREIQTEICNWLMLNGYFYWRQNNIPVFGRNNAGKMTFRAQSKHTPKGLPDIMVINHGVVFGIEVKRKGAMLRPDQSKMRELFNMNGGKYFVAFSLHDVEKVLSAHPRPSKAE